MLHAAPSVARAGICTRGHTCTLPGNDRQIVSARLKAHVQDPDNNNMLIFPEGTCVNNDFAIMFKKGESESKQKKRGNIIRRMSLLVYNVIKLL